MHQRKPSAPIIPVILGGDLLRVEYLGRGFFRAFNHEFTPEMRERVLPAEEARFLVANFPKLFRIRE
ncbi:MAG: hypothetical protein NZ651_06260 [Candidatus Bipolaricaulota bacterium]|nr:hypothetical protein [Candidatus Bipolaricaulota bacterium]MDW8127357.1 hypothetical protein [Candidatus Bipolaricaulota bacterium]